MLDITKWSIDDENLTNIKSRKRLQNSIIPSSSCVTSLKTFCWRYYQFWQCCHKLRHAVNYANLYAGSWLFVSSSCRSTSFFFRRARKITRQCANRLSTINVTIMPSSRKLAIALSSITAIALHHSSETATESFIRICNKMKKKFSPLSPMWITLCSH